MKKTHAIKKNSNIFEIRQLLQTFHKKFFHNRQISRETHQKELSVFVIKKLSDDI
jgi:hypothetical protein